MYFVDTNYFSSDHLNSRYYSSLLFRLGDCVFVVGGGGGSNPLCFSGFSLLPFPQIRLRTLYIEHVGSARTGLWEGPP